MAAQAKCVAKQPEHVARPHAELASLKDERQRLEQEAKQERLHPLEKLPVRNALFALQILVGAVELLLEFFVLEE